jgi:transcriptional regulator with XRE-family HTH domain
MSFNIDQDRANEEIVRIARKYDLNPVMLKEIVWQRNRGLNNAEIAQQLGINRNTVNKYVNALNEMNKDDLLSLLALIAIITAGAYLLSQLFEALNGGNR